MNTVRVRIAVAVDRKGGWNAVGWPTIQAETVMDAAEEGGNGADARYWVEADLPIPEIQTVNGEVKEA